MTTKDKLQIIKDTCSKVLSMTIKESYLSNIYILQNMNPWNKNGYEKLSNAIKEKCVDTCSEEENSPENLSREIFGFDLFDLDQYQIFSITYVFTQKLINDIFNDLVTNDKDMFAKTLNLRGLIDEAFSVDKDCRNKFKNKRYYSRLFRDFLDNRKMWYNKVNEEIDRLLAEME